MSIEQLQYFLEASLTHDNTSSSISCHMITHMLFTTAHSIKMWNKRIHSKVFTKQRKE